MSHRDTPELRDGQKQQQGDFASGSNGASQNLDTPVARNDESLAVWREYSRIRRERSAKMAKAMEKYDKTVYLPALVALRQRCGKNGHAKGKTHYNGWGGSFTHCNLCGTLMPEENV
jgi:hypothetical protein